jgi:hypothetical protein
MGSVFSRNEDIVFRKIEEEYILVPIRSNVGDLESLFILNGTGARVWELLDGKRTLEEIKSAVLDEYDISSEEAEADIKEYITALGEIGTVGLVED